MKKKLFFISLIIFIIIAGVIMYFKNDSKNILDFQSFLIKIEKKIPEVENINFRDYEEKEIYYFFSKDTLSLKCDKINAEQKQMWHSINRDNGYSEQDLPKSFLDDFTKVKNICRDLGITEIEKKAEKNEITFYFNLNILSIETIPNWDKKLSNKIDRYNGALIYNSKNSYEKENGYFKIKDNWYFEYYERRPS